MLTCKHLQACLFFCSHDSSVPHSTPLLSLPSPPHPALWPQWLPSLGQFPGAGLQAQRLPRPPQVPSQRRRAQPQSQPRPQPGGPHAHTQETRRRQAQPYGATEPVRVWVSGMCVWDCLCVCLSVSLSVYICVCVCYFYVSPLPFDSCSPVSPKVTHSHSVAYTCWLTVN